ncbi:MAG: hypothetical protein M3014_14945 [Chloroflexota bacterium]|nr:hypothetical protein [Chloroflexota bacterium]
MATNRSRETGFLFPRTDITIGAGSLRVEGLVGAWGVTMLVIDALRAVSAEAQGSRQRM